MILIDLIDVQRGYGRTTSQSPADCLDTVTPLLYPANTSTMARVSALHTNFLRLKGAEAGAGRPASPGRRHDPRLNIDGEPGSRTLHNSISDEANMFDPLAFAVGQVSAYYRLDRSIANARISPRLVWSRSGVGLELYSLLSSEKISELPSLAVAIDHAPGIALSAVFVGSRQSGQTTGNTKTSAAAAAAPPAPSGRVAMGAAVIRAPPIATVNGRAVLEDAELTPSELVWAMAAEDPEEQRRVALARASGMQYTGAAKGWLTGTQTRNQTKQQPNKQQQLRRSALFQESDDMLNAVRQADCESSVIAQRNRALAAMAAAGRVQSPCEALPTVRERAAAIIAVKRAYISSLSSDKPLKPQDVTVSFRDRTSADDVGGNRATRFATRTKVGDAGLSDIENLAHIEDAQGCLVYDVEVTVSVTTGIVRPRSFLLFCSEQLPWHMAAIALYDGSLPHGIDLEANGSRFAIMEAVSSSHQQLARSRLHVSGFQELVNVATQVCRDRPFLSPVTPQLSKVLADTEQVFFTTTGIRISAHTARIDGIKSRVHSRPNSCPNSPRMPSSARSTDDEREIAAAYTSRNSDLKQILYLPHGDDLSDSDDETEAETLASTCQSPVLDAGALQRVRERSLKVLAPLAQIQQTAGDVTLQSEAAAETVGSALSTLALMAAKATQLRTPRLNEPSDPASSDRPVMMQRRLINREASVAAQTLRTALVSAGIDSARSMSDGELTARAALRLFPELEPPSASRSSFSLSARSKPSNSPRDQDKSSIIEEGTNRTSSHNDSNQDVAHESPSGVPRALNSTFVACSPPMSDSSYSDYTLDDSSYIYSTFDAETTHSPPRSGRSLAAPLLATPVTLSVPMQAAMSLSIASNASSRITLLPGSIEPPRPEHPTPPLSLDGSDDLYDLDRSEFADASSQFRMHLTGVSSDSGSDPSTLTTLLNRPTLGLEDHPVLDLGGLQSGYASPGPTPRSGSRLLAMMHIPSTSALPIAAEVPSPHDTRLLPVAVAHTPRNKADATSMAIYYAAKQAERATAWKITTRPDRRLEHVAPDTGNAAADTDMWSDMATVEEHEDQMSTDTRRASSTLASGFVARSNTTTDVRGNRSTHTTVQSQQAARQSNRRIRRMKALIDSALQHITSDTIATGSFNNADVRRVLGISLSSQHPPIAAFTERSERFRTAFRSAMMAARRDLFDQLMADADVTYQSDMAVSAISGVNYTRQLAAIMGPDSGAIREHIIKSQIKERKHPGGITSSVVVLEKMLTKVSEDQVRVTKNAEADAAKQTHEAFVDKSSRVRDVHDSSSGAGADPITHGGALLSAAPVSVLQVSPTQEEQKMPELHEVNPFSAEVTAKAMNETFKRRKLPLVPINRSIGRNSARQSSAVSASNTEILSRSPRKQKIISSVTREDAEERAMEVVRSVQTSLTQRRQSAVLASEAAIRRLSSTSEDSAPTTLKHTIDELQAKYSVDAIAEDDSDSVSTTDDVPSTQPTPVQPAPAVPQITVSPIKTALPALELQKTYGHSDFVLPTCERRLSSALRRPLLGRIPSTSDLLSPSTAQSSERTSTKASTLVSQQLQPFVARVEHALERQENIIEQMGGSSASHSGDGGDPAPTESSVQLFMHHVPATPLGTIVPPMIRLTPWRFLTGDFPRAAAAVSSEIKHRHSRNVGVKTAVKPASRRRSMAPARSETSPLSSPMSSSLVMPRVMRTRGVVVSAHDDLPLPQFNMPEPAFAQSDPEVQDNSESTLVPAVASDVSPATMSASIGPEARVRPRLHSTVRFDTSVPPDDTISEYDVSDSSYESDMVGELMSHVEVTTPTHDTRSASDTRSSCLNGSSTSPHPSESGRRDSGSRSSWSGSNVGVRPSSRRKSVDVMFESVSKSLPTEPAHLRSKSELALMLDSPATLERPSSVEVPRLRIGELGVRPWRQCCPVSRDRPAGFLVNKSLESVASDDLQMGLLDSGLLTNVDGLINTKQAASGMIGGGLICAVPIVASRLKEPMSA